MAEHLDKQQLVRMAWTTALRNHGDRQCRGAMTGPDGQVCALGLLGEIAGIPVDNQSLTYFKVADSAGLEPDQMVRVFRMNDQGRRFAEIASVVDGWFA